MKSASLSPRSYADAAVLASLSLSLSVHAVDVIKLNNADNLNLGSSWNGGGNPPTVNDVGVWNSTVTAANTTSLGGALSWSGIRIADPGGPVAVNAGDSLTLGGGGIDMSAATQNLTLGNAVTLGAAQAWNVGTGRTLTLSGALAGSGGLTKSGAGILTLSGANTSSGAVAVTAGTLKGGAANALGSTTPVAGTSITAGATLDLGGFAQTTGSLSGAGIVTSSAAAASLTLGGDNATANFTGTLNSANITTVNKTGTGTQTLTGAGFWSTTNTTPQYNVLDGTLTIDATGVASVANITPSGWAVSAGKTFNLNYNTSNATLLFRTGALSGAGTVNLTGNGCIDFWSPGAGTSSNLSGFTGQLNIGCGSLSIQTDTLAKATTTASVNVSSGKFLDLRSQGFGCDKLTGTGIVADSHSAGGFGTLTVGTANGSSQFDGTIKDTDTTMPGYAAGGGIALTKAGTGTLTLTGPTTFTGATTINDGTLVVSNAAGWASTVSFATTNSPKLQINTPLATDAWTFTKGISGANASAAFQKAGPGGVTFTTSQSYTGATQVQGGKLLLQSTSTSLPTASPSIPGMKVWLDAADPEGDGTATTPAEGSSVAIWKNKGSLGASGDFTPTGTGANPVFASSSSAFNNQPVITFNAATGKQLVNATNFTNTLSVVYVGRIGATKQRLVSGNTVNWILGYWSNNMNVNYWNGGSLGSAADNNAHIWINGATGGTFAGFRYDAAGEASLGTGSGAAPTAGLMLGGGWAGGEKSDGEIAELFVFDHQLTTTERQQLEGYLYNKYLYSAISSASPVSIASGATFGGFGSAGNIAVSGGGTVEGGNSGSGTLTANNVTTSGAATFKGLLSTTAGYRALAVNNLAINGGDQSLLITPSGAGLTNGSTYDLLVSANPITAPGATSVQATLKSGSRTFTPVIDASGKKIQVIYDANASIYWTGAAGSGWNTSATSWKLSGNNLDTQFQANDVVYFHDSPASNVVDITGADVVPSSTVFDNTSATAYTLQGSNGISAGTITKANNGLLTVNNVNSTTGAVALNGGTVSLSQSGGLGTGNISFDGGTLSYGGSSITWPRNFTVNAGGGTLSLPGAATTLTLSGAIGGAGSLSKAGPGNLILTGANTYSGGTTISGGRLQLGNSTTSPIFSPSTYNISGSISTLRVEFLTSDGSATNLGNVAWENFTGTGVLNIATNGAFDYIGNDLALPAGFTGSLKIDGGRVQTPAGGGLGGATKVIVNPGGQLGMWNNGTTFGAGVGFEIAGTGYGESGIDAAIRMANGGATSTINGNVTLTGNATVGAAGTGIISGVISGSANLAIGSSYLNGKMELRGANTYTGTTTINAGTLEIGATGSLGSGTYAGTITNNGALIHSSSANQTLSGAITGSGSLGKTGSGTLTLGVANSYAGTTTVSGGTVLVTNATGSATGTGAVTVNASGTLGGTGSVSGAVTGAGTLAPGTTGIGNLTTGAVTLTGTYACQIGGATSDKLAVNGSLTLTGATLAVSTLSAPTASSYLIATYTGAVPSFTTVTGLPPGYALDMATAGQIKLVGNSAYSAWATSKGLTSANGGKHDNPDGDGLDNLMEYAFGTDPLASSGASIAWAGGTVTSPGSPTTSITNNGNTVDYRAVFGRRKDYLAAGLVYTVQFSADLLQWVDSSTTPTTVATGTEIDAVSVPYPLFIPTSRGMEKPTFFRVSVTATP